MKIETKREIAKQIAKKLRKETGLRIRVLRGNGTTEPVGHEKCDAYFVIEQYDDSPILYLNFRPKTASNIKKALDKLRIPYWWNGDIFKCFKFVLDMKEYFGLR